ncbi:ABC transporter ATP-binding protein [Novosphingobium lentum]|uniref:ABC transporter ATP-binding protein n=1 Tax=Novosphingobium lentum TaxID=145287 RepID=UPI0034E1A635
MDPRRIVMRNVSKEYPTQHGNATIFEDVNLEIGYGERVGILGRNGAGKSTMIRLISGNELPTRGSVTRSMTVSWPLALGGGFQGSLTGIDNIRFISRIYGLDPNEKIAFVEDFSELGSYLREPVKNYSNGMRARLAFAISMVVDFECFLIDEVIAVGDQRFRDKCTEELFEKRGDRAMIIISHDPEFVRSFCQRAVVIHDRKVHHFDTTEGAYHFYHEHIA